MTRQTVRPCACARAGRPIRCQSCRFYRSLNQGLSYPGEGPQRPIRLRSPSALARVLAAPRTAFAV